MRPATREYVDEELNGIRGLLRDDPRITPRVLTAIKSFARMIEFDAGYGTNAKGIAEGILMALEFLPEGAMKE